MLCLVFLVIFLYHHTSLTFEIMYCSKYILSWISETYLLETSYLNLISSVNYTVSLLTRDYFKHVDKIINFLA
jgi:hypothetical protein